MDVSGKQLLFKNLRVKFGVVCIRFAATSSQPLCVYLVNLMTEKEIAILLLRNGIAKQKRDLDEYTEANEDDDV